MPSIDRSTEEIQPSYGTILKEISSSTKDFIQSEVRLISAEAKSILPELTKHLVQATIYTSLLLVSLIAFSAFAILGVGDLLLIPYWMSALIVSAAFALIGVPLLITVVGKMKSDDFKFKRTRQTMDEGVETVKEKSEQLSDAAKGELNEQVLH